MTVLDDGEDWGDVSDHVKREALSATRSQREVLEGEAYTKRRQEVWARDDRRCVQCGSLMTLTEAEMDHIKLRKMGGGSRDDSPENLRTLCLSCHRKRHS